MRRRGGFSLTELLMAMAVFSTLLVMALMILHWALRGSQAQEADTRAAFLAQAKMEELFSADKPENGSGGFPAPQNEYRWTDEVKSLPGEFLDIAVTITGPRGCLYALKSQRRLAHRELVYGSQGTLLQSSEDYHERIQVPGTGGSYSLGPDGVTLAYIDSYQGKPQIHTRRINDREGKVLFESPQGAQEPVWSPDGKKIAFTTQENGFSQVFVYDLKSGLSENRSQSHHHDGSPSWTPDGAGILFCRDSSSILVTANGQEKALVEESAGWNTSPSLSDDGKQLAFMSNRDGNPEIYTMVLANGKITRLTNDPAYDSQPRFAPDGKRLLFISDRQDHQPRLYSVNLDGSQLELITPKDSVSQGFWIP